MKLTAKNLEIVRTLRKLEDRTPPQHLPIFDMDGNYFGEDSSSTDRNVSAVAKAFGVSADDVWDSYYGWCDETAQCQYIAERNKREFNRRQSAILVK